jgi:hypothetical protein
LDPIKDPWRASIRESGVLQKKKEKENKQELYSLQQAFHTKTFLVGLEVAPPTLCKNVHFIGLNPAP